MDMFKDIIKVKIINKKCNLKKILILKLKLKHATKTTLIICNYNLARYTQILQFLHELSMSQSMEWLSSTVLVFVRT